MRLRPGYPGAEEQLRTNHPDIGRQSDRSLLALDDALTRLASEDELKAQLIEMRYFGGMTAEESSEALSISVHVVRRHLRMAQAWLRKELAGGHGQTFHVTAPSLGVEGVEGE